jgi:hypothetical protein
MVEDGFIEGLRYWPLLWQPPLVISHSIRLGDVFLELIHGHLRLTVDPERKMPTSLSLRRHVLDACLVFSASFQNMPSLVLQQVSPSSQRQNSSIPTL